MGIFKSKDHKQVELAVGHLNQFLIDEYANWKHKLNLMLGAKAASEQPIEKVEPFVRLVWIEAYKFAMQLMIESRKKYDLVVTNTPLVKYVLGESEFLKATSDQSKRIGESVGAVVREICDIKPDWYPILIKHLEEPLLSELKAEAKKSMAEYLEINSKYHS